MNVRETEEEATHFRQKKKSGMGWVTNLGGLFSRSPCRSIWSDLGEKWTKGDEEKANGKRGVKMLNKKGGTIFFLSLIAGSGCVGN